MTSAATASPALPPLTEIRAWLEKASGQSQPTSGDPSLNGPRAAENTADVKKLIPAGGVDGSPQAAVNGGGGTAMDIGNTSYEADEKDPTAAVAKTVTYACDKSSGDLSTDDGFKAAVDAFAAAAARVRKLTFDPPAEKPAEATKAADAAAAPGYELFKALGYETKEAADAAVAEAVTGYVKYAHDAAAVTAGYMAGFNTSYADLVKLASTGGLNAYLGVKGAADEKEVESDKDEMPEGKEEGGDDAEPPAPGGDSGATSETPSGGDGPPAAGGAGNPLAALGGMLGGAGPDAGPGMAGAGGPQPSLDDLIAAILMHNQHPSQMADMASAVHGDMAAGAGGDPTKMAAAEKFAVAAQVMRKAAGHLNAGRYKAPNPKTAAEQKHVTAASEYVSELLARAKR